MDKLVSIIIPIYNSAEFLEQCIKSVRKQTYDNIEIILVNDGSTDESGFICEKYSEIDNRVVVIHKENGGQSSARNLGLSESKGDYIAFIDSDDVVALDYVEYLYGLINKDDIDISICRMTHTNYGDIICFKGNGQYRILNSHEAIKELLYQYSWLESPCNKLYKKALFDEIKFKENIIFEDSLLMPMLFEKCKKIIYGNAEKYAYIHRKNSTTTAKYSRKQLDILYVTDVLYIRYMNEELKKAALSYKMSANLRVYLNAPETEEYIDNIQKCYEFIHDNWLEVLRDKNVRKKTKISLILFRLGKQKFVFLYNLANQLTKKIKHE